MKERLYEHNLITLSGCIDATVEYIADLLDSCDEIRLHNAVPNPADFVGWMDLIATNIIPASYAEVGQSATDIARKRHPEWVDEYEARGWLDEDRDRALSSPCGINPYCWTALAFSCAVAFKDAIEDFEREVYPKNNGKPRKWGKVRSRIQGSEPARKRGGQTVNHGGKPRVKRKVGRPAKKTTRVIMGKKVEFPSQTESRRFFRTRGRPIGAKDDYNSNRQKIMRHKRRVARGNDAWVGPPLVQ